MAAELRAVNVGFAHGGRPVLHNVSVNVPAGSQVGITGPSGCGKTTLARVLSGLAVPAAGFVTVDGRPVRTGVGARGNQGAIAMLFQSPRRSCSPRMTLRAIVAEGVRARRRGTDRGTDRGPDRGTVRGPVRGGLDRRLVDAEVEALAARVQLTRDLLDRFPHEVSDGQLQRACLARVLGAEPDYLLCDEATAMLDAATTAAVVSAIGAEVSRRRLGVLAISHDRLLLGSWCSTVTDLTDPSA